ncbi:hypothetical protein [Magnetospirillum sulfuroxidans]|uniref:Biopolymer transport protein ExbD/TolR n=1 Tax=Magnetospirillum sulfuroxidans TaxID=611300 RepID=A0ABS5IER8_9PROT|nr:hypothetical protein [Magnetospirillum sulfuroxidans]MBR9972905.1 hypothetical protein [Magnetospirillum sulfuroxidans]
MNNANMRREGLRPPTSALDMALITIFIVLTMVTPDARKVLFTQADVASRPTDHASQLSPLILMPVPTGELITYTTQNGENFTYQQVLDLPHERLKDGVALAIPKDHPITEYVDAATPFLNAKISVGLATLAKQKEAQR